MPGFVSHTVVDTGNNSVMSVTIFKTQEQQRNADIYLDLCPYGCAGFQFSSNSDSLSDIIADAVSDIGGPGRQGLLAPILKSTYRKSSE